MNREQFTNWLILEGWQCCNHYKFMHDPWPLLFRTCDGLAIYGALDPVGVTATITRHLYNDISPAEWGGSESYPMFPFEKIPARHLAAIRKCLKKEGLI